MSIFKEAYDIIEKLQKSTKDNQILEQLLPIEEKLIAADKELVKIQAGNLELHKQIQAENFELQKENLMLKQRVAELEFMIRNKKLEQIGVIKERPDK